MNIRERFAVTALLALLFAVGVTGCSQDEDENPVLPVMHLQDKAVLTAMVDSMITEYRIPGAILGVRFPDGDVWNYCAGEADLSTGRPLTPSTPMKVGSITKTFTATVVLRLVEEGTISSLDDSLASYLPDSVSQYLPTELTDSVITIRRTLNHTTGIPNYVHDSTFAMDLAADPTRTFTPLDLIGYVADSLLFDPGTQWLYSNTNYTFLGLMVEHLTGNTLQEEMRQIIFEPLQLHRTWFPRSASEFPTDLAQGYYDFNGDSTLEASETITMEDPSAAWSAGAVVSTVGDLLNWVEALDTGDLLTPYLQSQRKMTINFYEHGDFYGYGLGIARQSGVAWGHQGGIDGYNAIINHHVGGYDFVVLVNGQSPLTGDNMANTIYVGAVKRIIGGPAKRFGKAAVTSVKEDGYSWGAAVLPH